jgi:hypothetical protein
MKRHFFVALALGVLCLSACATGPRYTPFQPATAKMGGFSEQRIEAGRYRVIFEGNSRTTRQRVEDSLLLRAADLTLENGFDWFEVVERATDAKTTQVRVPGPAFSDGFYSGFASYRVYSPRFGWAYHRDPFGIGPFHDGFGYRDELRNITRFEANAEIILGKGPKPEGRAGAFDAKDVKANVGPRVLVPVAAKG